PLRLHQRDDILDAADFPQQQVTILVDLVTAGDERAKRSWPAFQKDTKVTDGAFKGLTIGIDRADDDLIFQHEVAHDEVGVNRHRRSGGGNASEDINAVQPQHAQDVVGNFCRADGFVNEIDVADSLGELVNAFDLAGDVFRADGFDEFGLRVRRFGPRINAGFEAVYHQHHCAEDADRARAQ